MKQLWILRDGAPITPEDLQEALDGAARATLVMPVEGEALRVAGSAITIAAQPAVTADDFGGEPLTGDARERWLADPRRHRYLAVSGPDTAARYAASLLALELGASVLDPEADDWLSVDEHALADLRERLERA